MDAHGRPLIDDTLLLLLNAHWEPMSFVLPVHKSGLAWETQLDTSEPTGTSKRPPVEGGNTCDMVARSLMLLRLRGPDQKG